MAVDEEERRRINARQRQIFNAVVDRFDLPQPPEVMARLAQIVEAAGISPAEVVLDVGSGVGVLIPLIEGCHPATIHACDLAEQMLERLRARFPRVVTHQCDIQELQLPEGSVHVVFMNAMFANIADKEGALANVTRMLAPGGRLIISHPEGRSFIVWLQQHSDLVLEPFPSRQGFVQLLAGHHLTLREFIDEEKLLLVVAQKPEPATHGS